MLKGKRVKATGIRPPVAVDIYPAPSFENREAIILTHMRLATHIVAKYVRRYGRKFEDDFFGAAMLGLTKAADSIINGSHKDDSHRTSCIASFVHGEITNHLRKTWQIYVPRSSCHKENLPVVEALTRDLPQKEHEYLSVLDELLTLAANETERTVLKLKAQGFTDDEVAGVLGVSAITVWRTRIALRERYNRVCEE